MSPNFRHMCVTAAILTLVSLITSIVLMSVLTYYKITDHTKHTSVELSFVDTSFGKTLRMYQIIPLAFSVLLVGLHYYHCLGPRLSTMLMMISATVVLVFSLLTIFKMKHYDADTIDIKDNAERTSIKAMIYVSSGLGILSFLTCSACCLSYMLMKMRVT